MSSEKPKYRKEVRQLPVKLTEIEIHGKRATGAVRLLASDKAEQERLALAGQASDKKKESKGLQAEALGFMRVAASGEEKRQVTCEWRPAANGSPVMNLVRTDMKETELAAIVDTRAMTQAETRGDYTGTGSVVAASKEKASDSAAGNGHDREPKARKNTACPGTIAEPDRDDPTKDKVCAEPCEGRKWACGRHVGLPQGEKVRLVARQKERQRLIEEPATKAEELQQGAGAAN